MIFRGLGSVAAHFGWSVPNKNFPIHEIRPKPSHNTAHTVGESSALSLSLDPKRELIVDPLMLGEGVDELVISHLAAKEVFIQDFEWTTSAVPMSTVLLTIPVSPLYSPSVVNAASTAFIQPTPAAFCATPFQYWHGKMKIRVEAVMSNFHRGKFAVIYEPNSHQSVLIQGALDLNKNFVKVVDLQHTQNVEFVVEWASPKAWLPIHNGADSTDTIYRYTAGGITPATVASVINGFVTIVPFTEAQSPDDSSIWFNLYVSWPELRLAVPNGRYMPKYRRAYTESSVRLRLDCDVDEVTLNESTARPQHLSEYHFGEEVLSFRSLMKRYVTGGRASLAAGTGSAVVYYLTTPIIPGTLVPFGSSSTAAFDMSLIEYMRYAFLALTGSVRHRHTCNFINPPAQGSIWLARLSPPANVESAYNVSTSTTYHYCVLEGTVLGEFGVNSAIDVELPIYTNNLFVYACADDMVGTSPTDSMDPYWMRHYQVRLNTKNGGNAFTEYYTFHVSTGEDFNLSRFLGAPYFCLN